MTETLSAAIPAALNAAGIPAFQEYPQRPLPAAPFFVTAACKETEYGAPLDSFFGDALPFSLTLRQSLMLGAEPVSVKAQLVPVQNSRQPDAVQAFSCGAQQRSGADR